MVMLEMTLPDYNPHGKGDAEPSYRVGQDAPGSPEPLDGGDPLDLPEKAALVLMHPRTTWICWTSRTL